MISNVYIVSHILFYHHLYRCILSVSLLHMLRSLGIHLYPPPPPIGMRCHCSASWHSNSGNVAAGKGYKSCTHLSGISKKWLIGDGSKGVWHDQLANSSLPYCRYVCIVLLENNVLQQSDRLAGLVAEGLHPHSVGL